MTLNAFEEKIIVQAILFKRDCPSMLTFDYSLRISNLPNIDLNESVTHLLALIYENLDSDDNPSHLSKILLSNNEYKIAIFTEQTNSLDYFYIISHVEDKEGFGKNFSTSNFAIFVYSFNEIFGENIVNCIQFFKGIKRARSELAKELKQKEKILDEKEDETKNMEELVEFAKIRRNALDEEVELSRSAVEQLNYQIQKSANIIRDSEDINMRCILCKLHLKNVVFFPCGHVVYCNLCHKPKLDSVSILFQEKKKKEIIKCPLCSIIITESKVIKYAN